ncbi:MAG TPA: hypothetical protein VFV27_00005 [Nevskiaceae bacterium]|nr:hypothetical protein [Nevskiaceae bacterium]
MLYLHVGLHKTGTSAIQAFLHQNERRLRTLGYDYSPIGRSGANPHHSLGWELIQSGQQQPQLGGLADLAAACLKASGHVVVSSESFSRANDAQVRQLGVLFKDVPLQVVLYLRHPAELIQSSYFQLAKNGLNLRDFDSYFERSLAGGRVRFLDQARRWLTMASGRLRLRVYETGQLVNDDLIDDFLTAIDAAHLIGDPELKRQGLVNTSPGPKTIILTQELTRQLGGREQLTQESRLMLQKVREAATAAGWDSEKINLITPAHAQRVEEVCAQQMEGVAREILGRADGRLFYKGPRVGHDRLPKLTDLPHQELIAVLLQGLRQPADPRVKATPIRQLPQGEIRRRGKPAG